MRFEDLCLIYEENTRLTLIKSNLGRPLTAGDYESGISSYVSRNYNQGYSKMLFFLGKPNVPDKGYLTLYYNVVAEPNVPAKYFHYTIPEATLRRFRALTGKINNRNNEAYFQPRNNIFYYKGQPLPKTFPEKMLKREMESLIKVNEFFAKNFGTQYSFLGDVYVLSPESTFSKIAAGWEKK